MTRLRSPSASGFTLVELTVALVAGLIVALGIVGLSREATATFNEEVRNSAAEGALRTAVDRLRADLQRAGYMSTGNIMADNMIAAAPGSSNITNISANMKGLLALASIQLNEGESATKNALSLSAVQSPALAPDSLLIGGNMTCAEQFDVQMVMPVSASCQQILLWPSSPAIYRVATAGLANIPLASAELNNVFAPVVGNGTSGRFMVRLLDDTGHSQYLATCPRSDVAGIDNTGQPYLWIDSTSTPIITAQQAGGNGGISGYAAGRAWVNPVQMVRWEITSTAQEAKLQQQFANGLGNIVQGTQVDPNKYDLMRSFVDAVTGQAIPQSSEIVAEYAVDFDVAFTVDNAVYATGAQVPNLVTYAFDDAVGNTPWGLTVLGMNPPPASPPASIGPQRIRSVRARLVTRTALPDRNANIPVVNQVTNPQQGFMYRYCMLSGGCTGANAADLPIFARARTVTTEVSLPNNAGFTY